MANEADTCRKHVVPKLQAAGWDNEPHSIAEQRTVTDGRIIPVGKGFVRKPPKRVDYLLRYARDFPLAVVEAKGTYKTAADAVQQARAYAEMLDVKFAYATNGIDIIEIDYFAGTETRVSDYPKPADLWHRYQTGSGITTTASSDQLLTPYNHTLGKSERYYQQIAINRTVEAILKGDRQRFLLTMATGTGKTFVSFQICWKLWSSRWNRSGAHRRPRILYLADRNILVDQPKDGMFAAFGDARHKIESGEIVHSREMYFAIYQALAESEHRAGFFRDYPPDFFDLVIVDECHRGSARDDSSWRAILDHFKSAYQLGMTATPLRDDNRDTYNYFGNPIYEYSLRQGIEDGFLAPYRVHRVITEWDAAGWRPSKEELDRYGRAIPDDEYTTKDFERVVALRARTQAIARHLTDFLKKTDRFAKTIVFCVDQEHAADMREALVNLNSDLVAQFPDYVARVTADEAQIGRGHLSRFQDVETKTPTILTTSQLLTTGVDAPTCKNVVLARVVGSMSEFKQIIGRGTRLRDDYGKLWVNIIDYTGSATRMFADPLFDGDPTRITEEQVTEEGETTSTTETTPEGQDEPVPPEGDPVIGEPPTGEPRKFYFDGGQVEVVAHLVHELDPNGKQLRVVKYTDYAAESIRSLSPTAIDLRSRWANAEKRKEIIQALAERGVDFAKFLDDLEQQRDDEAKLGGKKFKPTIDAPYRWRDWAANSKGITGDELLAFINQDETNLPGGKRGPGLFAYLRSLSSSNGDNRRDVIATVFKGVDNRMKSGYLLRDVVNKIGAIHFTSSDELHTLGALYESMLREMRDAAGDSGEFYTPRTVVRFMVEVTDPRLGETVLDPASGTGGFLVEAYNYLEKQVKTVADRKKLQTEIITGCEPKSLPYLLCQMNLVLHGLDAPQIDSGNALRFKLSEIGEKERVDVILTNPPFGGEEEKGIQGNFPEDRQSSETALLFLQLIMRKLKRQPTSADRPARAAVVVPNGTLFGDGVCARLKEELLKKFNLHTIVRLPNGVFAPYTGIPTNILFFDRSGPTKHVWYYEQPLPEGRKNYTKTQPMQFDEFKGCMAWWDKRKENDQAWKVSAKDLLEAGCNLDRKNPRGKVDFEHLPPDQLAEDILSKELRIADLMREIKVALGRAV